MLDEKLREKMLERVFATINPKIEIKISSDGNKTKVKSKEKADKIKNIAEKEIEKNEK